MARPYGKRPRGGRGSGGGSPTDPAGELRDQAVRIFDQGDGHGADWAAAAIASLRVAFFCLQNLPADDPNRLAITRRAHDFAYDLMAGNPDNGAPFATGGAKPPRMAFSMTDPAPGHSHDPSR